MRGWRNFGKVIWRPGNSYRPVSQKKLRRTGLFHADDVAGMERSRQYAISGLEQQLRTKRRGMVIEDGTGYMLNLDVSSSDNRIFITGAEWETRSQNCSLKERRDRNLVPIKQIHATDERERRAPNTNTTRSSEERWRRRPEQTSMCNSRLLCAMVQPNFPHRGTRVTPSRSKKSVSST